LVVKLRLKRFGRLNHPTYRVCAADSRSQRDGRIIETLGFYLPKLSRVGEQVKLNAERISYWLSVGAQPSETVASLVRKAGIALPARRARKPRKRKAKPWVPPPKKQPKVKAKPKAAPEGEAGA
jgi:small subunit ribosomal protein S16